MTPNIHINMLAVIIAVVANFIFGFLWYAPLFGKAWSKEMGFDPNQKPPAGAMMKGMLIMIIGSFLMVWVFAHNIAVWNPVTWGQAPSEMSAGANAFAAAMFTWLGFYLPTDLGAIAWEQKTWKLLAINTAYHFLSLLISALILISM